MAREDYPTVDIIVPCLHNTTNNLVDTLRCLESIQSTTSIPHRLIIIENPDRHLADKADLYIGYSYPRTCAENVNSGLLLSTADYSCIVTNDVFVREGWLEALFECFMMVGCGVATLDSSQFGSEPRNEITEDFFGGIWMVRKDVLKTVGYWDETFRHAFDDADYWVRVYKAGYKVFMNHRVVVQHDKGGQTIYPMNGKRHNEIFDKNRTRFNQKHEGCQLPIFHKLR